MFSLEPTTIALIGASAEEKKLGHYILKNLLNGFTGTIFPINPKHDEMMGLRCFHSITDIKENIDMAVIVTPASTVSALAEECGKKKVKTLVVISAGFGELGTEEGHAREKDLAEICEKYGMSLVGPNCLGVLRPSIGLNASFAEKPDAAGDIALISQSGAMAVALLDAAAKEKLGFSLVVSIGNKADLTETEFLEVCEHDEKTKVIGLYLESVKDGKGFMQAAERIAKKKPIVLIKSGVSFRGAKAVSSHTGALAGSTAALQAACRSAGIHLAHSTQEFMAMLTTFRASPSLVTPRIAIITNAGGPGVLATDAAEAAGLQLVSLEATTITRLQKILPEAASTANPIDVLGDALGDRYAQALDACADDPNVDGIVALLTPQVMTPCDEIARAVVATKDTHPLLPITTAFMGGSHVESARAILRASGIPSFATPEEAVNALALLRTPKHAETYEAGETDDDRTSAAVGLIGKKKGLLSEEATTELFALYDLSVPKQAVATSAKEAVEIAKSIGYPVIAKISSPQILHKTDVGGVRVNLKTDADVKKAYEDILKNCEKNMPAAGVSGVLIQQFLPIGSEFIVGALRDSTFGPIVMVGLGGIYTELFRDTHFEAAPISLEQAYVMLGKLQSWKLLLGMRGKGALDIDGLASVLYKISCLIAECPSITEIDLNPVLVGSDKIVVADAKVVVV